MTFDLIMLGLAILNLFLAISIRPMNIHSMCGWGCVASIEISILLGGAA